MSAHAIWADTFGWGWFDRTTRTPALLKLLMLFLKVCLLRSQFCQESYLYHGAHAGNLHCLVRENAQCCEGQDRNITCSSCGFTCHSRSCKQIDIKQIAGWCDGKLCGQYCYLSALDLNQWEQVLSMILLSCLTLGTILVLICYDGNKLRQSTRLR